MNRKISTIQVENYKNFLQEFAKKSFQDKIDGIKSQLYNDRGDLWEAYEVYKLCMYQLDHLGQDFDEVALLHINTYQLSQIVELNIYINENSELQEILGLIYDQKEVPRVQCVKSMQINSRSPPDISRQPSEQNIVPEYRVADDRIPSDEEAMSLHDAFCQEEDRKTVIQMEQIQENEETLLEIALNHRRDANLDEAYAIVKKLNQNNFNKQQQYAIRDVIQTYEFMVENLQQLDSQEWIVDKAEKGISVSYKFPKNTPTVSLLIEAVIETNVCKLMALISEVELFPKYVPFCNHARLLKEISKTQKVCQSQLYFPIISDRETTFVGEGIDRLQHNGTILFLCRSINKDMDFIRSNDISIPQSKAVELHLNYYLFQIRPLSRDRCQIRAVNNSDPQLPFVPKWVAGFIARKFTYNLIEKIVKYTKNFEKSPWYSKYQQNIQFYNWLEEKLNSFLSTQQQQ